MTVTDSVRAASGLTAMTDGRRDVRNQTRTHQEGVGSDVRSGSAGVMMVMMMMSSSSST